MGRLSKLLLFLALAALVAVLLSVPQGQPAPEERRVKKLPVVAPEIELSTVDYEGLRATLLRRGKGLFSSWRNNGDHPQCVSAIECTDGGCPRLEFLPPLPGNYLGGRDPGNNPHLWKWGPTTVPPLPLKVSGEGKGGATHMVKGMHLLGFCLAPEESREEPLPVPVPGTKAFVASVFSPTEVWNAAGLFEPMGGAVVLRYDVMKTPWPRHPRPGEMVRPELRNELIGPPPEVVNTLVLPFGAPAEGSTAPPP